MRPFAFVRRREPNAGRDYVVPTNENVPLNIVPQGAPDTIRQSDFYMEGKPPSLAISHARVAFTVRPRSINGIDNQSFAIGKTRPAVNVILQPTGGQSPLASRANISRPTPITNGDIAVSPGGIQGYVPRGTVSASGLTYTSPHKG